MDKIAKKLIVFKGSGEVLESVISYSEHLENEEDLMAFCEFEKSLEASPKVEKPRNDSKKLSYKEQRAYENLPHEISKLEDEIKFLEECQMDKACYEANGGLVEVHNRCENLKIILEEKVEIYLDLEDKITQLKENG